MRVTIFGDIPEQLFIFPLEVSLESSYLTAIQTHGNSVPFVDPPCYRLNWLRSIFSIITQALPWTRMTSEIYSANQSCPGGLAKQGNRPGQVTSGAINGKLL